MTENIEWFVPPRGYKGGRNVVDPGVSIGINGTIFVNCIASEQFGEIASCYVVLGFAPVSRIVHVVTASAEDKARGHSVRMGVPAEHGGKQWRKRKIFNICARRFLAFHGIEFGREIGIRRFPARVENGHLQFSILEEKNDEEI